MEKIFISGIRYGKTALMEEMAKDWLLQNPNGKVIKIGYKDCKAADNGMKNFIKYFRDLDMEDCEHRINPRRKRINYQIFISSIR